ncbi:MAG: RagB/SusD family nutrient uptake outer membrane protein, partial [Turicibacter sp.]
MKNIFLKIKVVLLLSVLFVSCNDDFLNRYPQTNITEKNFFKTDNDLMLYTNYLYSIGFPYLYSDIPSDNVISVSDNYMYKLLRGEINEELIPSWSGWSEIRKVNFMLQNVGDVTGDRSTINHYIGIARMIRGICYYRLVRKYSDVPWYSKALETTDTDLLYKKQDPRTLVVDSIMADLQFAVENISKDEASKSRVNIWSAYMTQARIALEEGTFRKYHDELNLTDGDKYIELAAAISKKIIDSNKFKIYTEDSSPYEALFRSSDLSSNPEIIMFNDFDKALGRTHDAQSLCNRYHSISRDMMEDYLYIKNGIAIPYKKSPVYGTQYKLDIFKDRDPRMAKTIMPAGYKRAGYGPERANLGLGGYPQIKFNPLTLDQLQPGLSYNDIPLYRYAETLLIYAEAQAELGVLTQADLDISINKLRDRVKMPLMNLADVLSTIDECQVEHYPNVNGPQKGAILEIRRERRIELACEGFRYDDLMRWKVGDKLAKTPEGMRINKLGYHDIT